MDTTEASGGDESVDSIPPPEYEVIESIKEQETKCEETITASADQDTNCETGKSGPVFAMEASHGQNVIPMEHDYNEPTDSEKVKSKVVPRAQLSNPASTQPKLVQAKTKDNKVVLVELVDENGKTFRPLNETTSTRNTELNIISPIVEEKPIRNTPQQQSTKAIPMSRECLALQKSVNASKILTEFVTDISMEKARKRKPITVNTKDLSKAALNKSNTNDTESQHDNLSKFPIVNDSTTESPSKKRVRSDGKCIIIEDHVTADSPVSQTLMNENNNKNDPFNYFVKLEASTPIFDQTESNWLSHDKISIPNSSSARKTKQSKFVPLKDESNQSESSIYSGRPKRSRSCGSSTPCKLEKWSSDEKMLKRSNMRSQNSDFVQKQMDFLKRVAHEDDDEEGSETEEHHSSYVDVDGASQIGEYSVNETIAKSTSVTVSNLNDSNIGKNVGPHRKSSNNSSTSNQGFEKYLEKIWLPPPKRGSDSFCWKCRECSDLIPCSKCVRSFHPSCIKVTATTKLDKTWVCSECISIENVLNGPRRQRRNELSLDLLSQLLSFALKRMRHVKGVLQFEENLKEIVNFPKYFANPVTFASLRDKIEKKAFRCAEEFVNETKWLHHNALLATGGASSKDSSTAKVILKICRQEAIEIDTCAECYLNANTRSDWFVDVCSQPHLILWAKLKGFPYWPAKAMGLGQGALVNVRFFGKHDRAFVPAKDCFLYSETAPNPSKKSSRAEYAECLNEVQMHIEKIKEKIGAFNYAPHKTPYDPAIEMEQLEMMMPGAQEYIKKQQSVVAPKPPLQYKIVKSADNHLSIIKKTNATDSGTESDHSLGVNVITSTPNKEIVPSANEVSGGSAAKKKLAEIVEPFTSSSADPVAAGNLVAEHGKSAKSATTSNYEVIQKIPSDDTKNSKVNTVILKRKSDQINESKNKSEEIIELPLPKMTKIEEDKTEILGVIEKIQPSPEKTLQEPQNHKTRHHHHPKSEPKIPVLTIKTNSTSNTNTSSNINKNAENREVNGRKDIKADAQSTVENLVKFKQGVTIKKINKDDAKKKAMEPILQETPTDTLISDSKHVSNAEEIEKIQTCDAKSQKNALNKSKQTQMQTPNQKVDSPQSSNGTAVMTSTSQQAQLEKDKLILKDLVPFVEVKKEVISDDEENNKNPTVNVSHANQSAPTNAMQPPPTATPESFSAAPQPQLPQELVQSTDVLLSTVKQEVVSDNEDDPTKIFAQPAAEKSSSAAIVEKSTPASIVDTVRVVGDTTIQRISTKSTLVSAEVAAGSTNSTIHTNLQAQNSQISMPITGSIYINLPPQAASPTMNAAAKRSSLRGIPYGPLPATATTAGTKLTSTNLEHNINVSLSPPNVIEKQLQQQQQLQQQLRQNQRARKTFPNRSPPEVSPVRCIATPLLQISPAASPSPVTVTASSSSSSAAGSGIHNIVDPKRTMTKTSMVSIPVDVATSRGSNSAIPVPPLTAVTKITPLTSTAANVVSIPSLPATATSIAASSSFLNCNGAGTMDNIVSSAQHLINVTTAMTMSVPPPLAGLSYNTFTVASSLATVTTAAATSISTALTSPLASSSVQIQPSDATAQNNSAASAASALATNTADTHLLGDFVTPTLASAITELICRGPPRLSARPNGPLQSDGSTMFPSQAGPVCQTLVVNAHKLTDFFISVMEDTMCEMSNGDEPVLQAKITLLTMELERTKQTYEREIAELKRTSDLMLCEMRKSMENEKIRNAAEVRKQCELERIRSVEETKKKQWCAHCGNEAQFYCCWNTSYCGYTCQQMHWGRHAASCAQTRSNETTPGSSSVRSGATSMNTSNISENPTAQHRHHGNTKSSSSATNTTHYNSKTVISSKKDKLASKSTSISNSSMTSNVSSSAEMLKLPSNTYLRPVASSNTTVRTTSYPAPGSVQRFNIPLPIAAPANPGLPYTLVQREGNWELMSAAANSTQTTSSNTAMPITNATAGLHQTPPSQQQQTRLVASSAMSTKHNPRNRVVGNNSSVTMQTLNSSMHTAANLQSGTMRPSTHM